MRALYPFLEKLFLQAGMPAHIANGLAFFLYDILFLFIVLSIGLTFFTFIRVRFLDDRLANSLDRKPKILVYGAMALLGIVSPFCSCSAIPAFIALAALNVPTGALFVYLVVAPLVQETSMILLFTQFGIPVTIIYIIQGVIAGIITGLILSKASDDQLFTASVLSQRYQNSKSKGNCCTNVLSETEKTTCCANHQEAKTSCCCSVQETTQTSCGCGCSAIDPKKNPLHYAVTEAMNILKKTFKYILIGVAFGALIHGVIPQEWIEALLGTSNHIAPIYATLIGIPIYADDVALIPIAKSLLDSGAALGTALSFVMASAVVSVPSFILLGSVLQKKVIVKLAIILTVAIIVIGYIFNFIQPIIL